METAEEGVWIIDGKGVTTFVNRKICDMLGLEPEEIIGKKAFDFVDDAYKADAQSKLGRRQVGIREHYELVFRHRDGRKVWAAMAASPLQDSDGGFLGSLAMVSDVTERRRNEILLSTQRSIFELLLQGKSMPDALEPLVLAIEKFSDGMIGSIVLLDEEKRHLHTGTAPHLPAEFNQAIEGAEIGPQAGSCGTSAYRKELVVVNDIDTDPLWNNHREVARKFGLRACWSSPILAGTELFGTFALYFKEPRSPTASDLQLVGGFSAAAGLVIQHVRTRDSLAESEASFRLLAEAASEGIAIHEQGRILIASRSLAEMYGYKPEELVGTDILQFTLPEDRSQIVENIRLGRNARTITQAMRKDGTRIWVDVKAQDAVFRGRPVRLLAIRNITDEKRLEEARESLLRQERTARQQAETAIRVRDEFLAIASHELRTPLTPLKIELQLLRMAFSQVFSEPSSKTELLKKALDHGEWEIDRLGRLISDLLDVTRISAGHLKLNIEPNDLAKVVRIVIERFSTQFKTEGCELKAHIVSSLIGNWDAMRIDQVVTNLITNALKYGRGSPIEVTLVREGDIARLSVRDRGIGIASEDQDRIFDRFVRAVPVENYGGLGLGLFVVKEIVQAHGGMILVESEFGKGSCFTVELPILHDSRQLR